MATINIKIENDTGGGRAGFTISFGKTLTRVSQSCSAVSNCSGCLSGNCSVSGSTIYTCKASSGFYILQGCQENITIVVQEPCSQIPLPTLAWTDDFNDPVTVISYSCS